MIEKKHLMLSEYMPKSQLVTDENIKLMPKYQVIDIHSHYGAFPVPGGYMYRKKFDTQELIQTLRQQGVRRVVNLGGGFGEGLEQVIEKTSSEDDFFITFCTLDISSFEDCEFELFTKNTMKHAKEKGAKGLKLFKNASLSLRDKSGNFVGLDDKRLSVIWETAAELQFPVLIHIGDPIAFFKPVDEHNERYEEIMKRPSSALYGQNTFSFEQLLEIQENLLMQNPDTTFIVAHVGSYSENLRYVGKCLDRFSNMYIDIADRIAELGRQPYTARKFFIEYQDRILFGTDSSISYNSDYPIYYRFLETFDEYFDYSSELVPIQGRWKIYGIGLDDEILQKIYFKNAEKVMKIKESI